MFAFHYLLRIGEEFFSAQLLRNKTHDRIKQIH